MSDPLAQLEALLKAANVDDARQALRDACHIVWYHKSLTHDGCEHSPHFWTIPVDEKRDVDVRIGNALDTLVDLVNAAPSLIAELRAGRMIVDNATKLEWDAYSAAIDAYDAAVGHADAALGGTKE